MDSSASVMSTAVPKVATVEKKAGRRAALHPQRDHEAAGPFALGNVELPSAHAGEGGELVIEPASVGSPVAVASRPRRRRR